MQTILEMYPKYLEALHNAKLSPRTQRAYSSRIAVFARYSVKSKSGNIREQCSEFLEHLQSTNDISHNSINAYRTALIHFLRHSGTDSGALARVTPVPPLRPSLSGKELETFLREGLSQRNIRNRLIVALISIEKLRLTDCITLDVANLVYDGTFRVEALMVRGRRHILDNATIEIFNEFRPEVRQYDEVRLNGPLLLNRWGTRMTTTALDYILRHVGFKCNMVVSARMLHNSEPRNSLVPLL